jgi:hypothetical protein
MAANESVEIGLADPDAAVKAMDDEVAALDPALHRLRHDLEKRRDLGHGLKSDRLHHSDEPPQSASLVIGSGVSGSGWSMYSRAACRASSRTKACKSEDGLRCVSRISADELLGFEGGGSVNRRRIGNPTGTGPAGGSADRARERRGPSKNAIASSERLPRAHPMSGLAPEKYNAARSCQSEFS